MNIEDIQDTNMYSVQQIAAILGVGKRTINAMFDKNLLPNCNISGVHKRCTGLALKRYIDDVSSPNFQLASVQKKNARSKPYKSISTMSFHDTIDDM